jgi:hypothetical protein
MFSQNQPNLAQKPAKSSAVEAIDITQHVPASIIKSAELLKLLDGNPQIFTTDEKTEVYLRVIQYPKYQGWRIDIIERDNSGLKKEKHNHGFVFKDKILLIHVNKTDPYTTRVYDGTKKRIPSVESCAGIADSLLYSYWYDRINPKNPTRQATPGFFTITITPPEIAKSDTAKTLKI